MDSAASSEEQIFFGRVKSYNYARGFGFLESPSVQALYGKDVFLRKEAVEEVTLSRIASGSGPDAVKDRGELFVSFRLKLNETGNGDLKPEAIEVREARADEVPEEVREQLPQPSQPSQRPQGGYSRSRSEPEPKASNPKETSKEIKEIKKGKRSKGKEGHPSVVGDCRVLVGRDAADNWSILASAKKKHWFFHLTDSSSCYVILECTSEPSADEKQQCAQICREHSQKSHSTGPIKVDATPCGNVKFDRKHDAVGECEYRDESKVEVLMA